MCLCVCECVEAGKSNARSANIVTARSYGRPNKLTFGDLNIPNNMMIAARKKKISTARKMKVDRFGVQNESHVCVSMFYNIFRSVYSHNSQ